MRWVGEYGLTEINSMNFEVLSNVNTHMHMYKFACYFMHSWAHAYAYALCGPLLAALLIITYVSRFHL